MTSDSAIVLANSDHVATSFFMLPCRSVHHVGRPRLRLTSSDPSVQIYSCSPPNLSLGLHLLVLHLAPSTATSHPAPALHNQGKHKYTTIVNHSLQQHWSSLSLSFAQFILHYLIFFSIAREFCSTFKLRVCQTWKTGEYIFSEKNELEENHSKFQNEKMVSDTPASTLQDSIILISSCIQ